MEKSIKNCNYIISLKEHSIHPNSSSIKFRPYDNVNEVADQLFKSLHSKY